MMELWQLYNEEGQPLVGRGANREDVFTKGLLHGAAHVWMWRKAKDTTEILLQQRAADKQTWPNRYDVSAAGHIDLGEEPVATALRETKEEIGLGILDTELNLISIERRKIQAPNGAIENEFCWVYIVQLEETHDFRLQPTEVSSLDWKKLDEFKTEVLDDQQNRYVPQGSNYFNKLITAIDSASLTTT